MKLDHELAERLGEAIAALYFRGEPLNDENVNRELRKLEMETTVMNVEIVRQGTQIILPPGMSYDEGIEWLMRKKDEEMKEVAFRHEIDCSPLDGMVAFQKALAEKYGFVNLVPTPGFFGSNPPKMIGVPVGPNETIHVPYGRMTIPGVDGYIEMDLKTNPSTALILYGKTRRRCEAAINEIAALTRKHLKSGSIYKGKAVKVSFEWETLQAQGVRRYDMIQDAPAFMDLNPELEATLIFGEKVAGDLNIGLFTPIEQAEACRKYGVPLKRGVLLYGPYGTGKTLTANITALKAQKAGWTFIYLDSVRDLKRGLEFATQYAPAIVFAEDIDRVMSGPRSLALDDILNTLDGVDTKNGEIITVFTTNHIEKINPALLRMGRLDALIEVAPPDAGAAARLVKLYSRGLLEETANLDKIGERLAGKIPAFIREVTERAKIAAISRLGGADIEGKVQEVDLLTAAHAMETHNALIWGSRKPKNPAPEVFVRLPHGFSCTEHVLGAVTAIAEENGHDSSDIELSYPAASDDEDEDQLDA